jgi:hypothetical protein
MNRLHVVAVVGVLCLARTASAQVMDVPMAQSQPIVADSASHVAQRSAMDRPSDAVRRSDRQPAAAAPLPSTGQHLGEAKAEMLVGGAAIVVGALIGGDGGRVLMFGGAVVGLYGLWNYLK